LNVKQLYDLSGKVAIVTGGSTGLGKQMAEGMAEAGANLVICARNLDKCEQTAAEISKLGIEVLAVKCDITNMAEVNNLVTQALDKFGKIDILVNNAGISWAGKPEEIGYSDWLKVMDVNVNGVFLCAQAVGKQMITRKQGKIINIASIAGLVGTAEEVLDTIPYNTSKAAVINFTRDLAVKWAKYQININAIAPGFFPTHLSKGILEHRGERILRDVPLQRFGGDDEIKGIAVFLAAPASNYITGHTIVVDGGMTAW